MPRKKEIIAQVKLLIPSGKANPAPPVGPALGPHGINIMEFCKQFNAQTKNMADTLFPVVLNVYNDRSFTFALKTPPASELIKKALGIVKGSSVPNKNKVGVLTNAQIEEIAKTKLPDLNTDSIESAINIITGTAKSMGVET
ncbi:50S ribosomal protein L11 [Thermodesulfovibrionales bacterium]|nr:50S ribosomal protein L11 [Thermodesulfovibrionales bacterium]MCL0047194.1 50S ribosomal protein L11 [Thermodesulfovibrionales bacterium]MCL0084917.1 50S ribosomal protein L11 [Thermodesulfovibrionales bacterium]MCL0085916.1 50S ribosomal protein L11 [Thermodesulfovibrionales bacterium]